MSASPDPHGAPSHPASDRLRTGDLHWSEIGDAVWLTAARLRTSQDGSPGESDPPSAASDEEPDRAADRAADRPASPKPLPEPDVGLVGPTDHPDHPADEFVAQLTATRIRSLPLRMASGLRPAKRLVPYGADLEIDEETTAAHGLEDDLWFAYGTASQERWMTLFLVVDRAPSMQIWQPTIEAWYQAVQRTGFFRDVRMVYLEFRAAGPPTIRARRSGRADSLASLVDTTGRRAFLIFTDGISGDWFAQADPLFAKAGSSGPTAVVHLLGRETWHRTAVRPHTVELAVSGFARPNTGLRLRPSARLGNPLRPLPERWTFPVPVLSLTKRHLHRWSMLIAGQAPGWHTVPVVFAGAPVEQPSQLHVTETSEPDAEPADTSRAVDLVRRFRAHASPTARRLAAQLAAAPFELPLVRELQTRLLPASRPEHLSELVLGGLIRWRDHGGEGPDFVGGVRENLLAASTRAQTARVVRTVAELCGADSVYGRSMRSALEEPDHSPLPEPRRENLSILRTELAVMRALSGPYLHRAERLAGLVDDLDRRGDVAPARLEYNSAEISEMSTNSAQDVVTVTSTESARQEVAPMRLSGDERSADGGPLSQGDSQPWTGFPLKPGTVSITSLPQRNPIFTGRGDLLAQIDRQLRASSVAAVIPHALHGMGGVGKSQIALEYCYLHKNEYNIVFWIPAEQEEGILGALVDLAAALSLPVGPQANTAVPAVLRALQNAEFTGRWLLVFDNAESIETVARYKPTGGQGKIIITSRNPEWSRSATTLSVDVFERAESVQLLRRRVRTMSAVDADRLAATLGDLPLAIEQAGAWCVTSGMSVDEYLAKFEERGLEALELFPSADYPTPLAKVFDISLEQLHTRNPAALQLLQVCAFFAPEPIPRSLLRGSRQLQISPELDPVLRDPIKLARAIRDINVLALAKLEPRTDTIQLHRLVQNVLVKRMSEEEVEATRHGAHLLLANANPDAPGSADQWPKYLAIQPHLIVSEAARCADVWVRECIISLVSFLYYWGAHDMAATLARQAMLTWTDQSGETDGHVLRVAKWLAFVLRLMGIYDEAANLNEVILDRYRATSGDDDEETLDAMTQMAHALRIKGDFTAAVAMDRQAFERCRVLFGEDDPTTLQAAHGLGVSLRQIGDFSSALRLDEETANKWLAIYGETNDRTLNTQGGLALDLMESGRVFEAVKLQEEIYRVSVKTYGIDNAGSIRLARALAVCRRRAGQINAARELIEATLTRFETRYGSMYPDTLMTATNAIIDRRLSGDLHSSRTLGLITLEGYVETLGERHPHTLSARVNLAATLRALGDLEEASALDEIAVEGLEATMGADHFLTLTATLGRANDLYLKRRFEQARRIDAAALEKLNAGIGREHPLSLSCAANLALDLRALGRLEEAAALQARALAGFISVLGEDHPTTSMVRTNVRIECDIAPMPT